MRGETRRGEERRAASDFNRNGNLSVSDRKIDSSSNERVILGVRTYVRTYVGEEGQSRLNAYANALEPVGVLREICMLIYSARSSRARAVPVYVCMCALRRSAHVSFEFLHSSRSLALFLPISPLNVSSSLACAP